MNDALKTYDEQFRTRVAGALARQDRDEFESILKDIYKYGRRKEKGLFLELLNGAIIERAFELGEPAMLDWLTDVPHHRVFDTMRRALNTYIATREARWFDALHLLSEKLERKSYQSRIFSRISRELIEKGVETKDPDLVKKGIEIAQAIGFRKYQADIMIDIVPLIIVWGIETRDTSLLYQCLEMIDVIGDISKHSLLQSELVKALATIGAMQGDSSIIINAVRHATGIRQKHRRISCILAVIERLWKSGIHRGIADIEAFLDQLRELSGEQRLEIVGIIAEYLLERTRDKRQLVTMLEALSDVMPGSDLQVVLKLLEKAEKSAEKWYIDRALDLISGRLKPGDYPVRELVSSAISVVNRTKDIEMLLGIIPLVEGAEKVTGESYISQYLAIVDTLLGEGEFSPALELFSRIVSPFDRTSKHTVDTTVQLIKEGILRREPDGIKEKVLSRIDPAIADSLVQRAVLEICKECDFNDFISYAPSFEAIVVTHRNSDSLIFEGLKLLISRGFMEYLEPSALLHLAERIQDRDARETAISYIVVEMAKIGVFLKNRDILQRAVGLTCQIEGQRPRSEALSRIIDQASYLAVEQSDLNFLHRMGEWIKTLLEKDYEVYAKESIIEGMIKYGVSQGAPHALFEAYQLTSSIEDANLQLRKRENIIEGLIRIGCGTFIQETPQDRAAPIHYELTSFEKALELLKQNVSRSQIGLKLSRYVDIVMEYAEKSGKPDFIIPLTMLVLEMENPLERSAMFYRLANFFRRAVGEEEAATPYEVILSIFRELEYSRTSPAVMNLMYRLIQQTPPSFTKFSSLCNLADSYMRIGENERAFEILHAVHASLEELSDPSERVIILTNLVGLLARVNVKEAHDCLDQALSMLPTIQEERRSPVLKQIIFSIVSLNVLKPGEEYLNLALELVEKIGDPVEYANALISIFGMAPSDEKKREILGRIYHAIDRIPVPYDRANLLLDVVPLADRFGSPGDPIRLLGKAEETAGDINIPFIATMVRQGIVQMLYMFYIRTSDQQILQRAREVAGRIEDEEMRRKTLMNLGVTEKEITPSPMYTDLLAFKNKIKGGRFTAQEADTLHRAIRSIPDRAERAKYYMKIALACRDAGQTKLMERMLQLGLEEASIIRPLSKRANVLGDIALTLYANKEEERAKDILGIAVDAAINIKEEGQREEVFDELSVALRIIEEHLV